jgi:hypothetical protein
MCAGCHRQIEQNSTKFPRLFPSHPNSELADQWGKLPNSNPTFGGRAALELMINAGKGGVYKIRRLLDGRCQ